MKTSRRSCLLVVTILALTTAATAAEKQKSHAASFPFDIIEGAAQATGAVIGLPLQALSSYHPSGAGTKGWDPHWRYTKYGYKTPIQREYLQLNWYDDTRRGYSELHEWKEADEELYQMFRK